MGEPGGPQPAVLTWLQAQLAEIWPGVYGGVDPEALYRAANVVAPSLIRVEADEVTYNLHIILRMEIERALVAGEVEVADLPALWREKVRKYLGLEVPTDREGVLQDIHWCLRPVRLLPHLRPGQPLRRPAVRGGPAPPAGPGRSAGPGRDRATCWAGCGPTCTGRAPCYRAGELCVRVTGRPLSTEPFLAHLRTKFGAVYGITI